MLNLLRLSLYYLTNGIIMLFIEDNFYEGSVSMPKKYLYYGEKKFDRKKFDTSETGPFSSRQDAEEKFAENLERINELQQKLYAEKREGIIFLFQAMDAAGKDGTIRAVLSCLSPHGVTEYAFKAPSADELAHGFMWRISCCAPERGHIAIFNRSQYEDVLIGKVHRLYMNQSHAKYIDDDQIIDDRYDDIINFEKYLYNNSVRTVKIYLNISKDEQARRFLSRIDDADKNWKFANEDIKERGYWDDYQKALEDAINKTSTEHCPWYVVPADHKWYMRYLVSQIIRETLEDIDPHFPEVSADQKAAMLGFAPQLRKELGDK